jgi:cation diffusion facilitator family transporter
VSVILFRTVTENLKRFAWLSIAAAVTTITLKSVAYLLTGSVGLLSDAVESIVNLIGAMMALGMLAVAARPADDDHAYGHSKAEYFSASVEGVLILIAALSIGVAGVERMLAPRPLEQVGVGLAVSAAASLVNLGVALVLLRAGREHHSITLEANAKHLLTDVWTSVGVILGVSLVAATGWQRLDPAVAILVAGNIVWTAVGIIRQSIGGLMDAALPATELAAVKTALESRLADGIQYHALRTRVSGARRFVEFHVLVPGDWTVHRGHALLEDLEARIRAAVPNVTVSTHLESLDDPASWEDEHLDRPGPQP